MSESESSTTRPNAESFNSFETAEIDKREIIKRQLETNFPMKTTVLFGSELVLIGIVGIFLQIGLIANKALNYEIGNGIWGGFFAILNGLVRLNMARKRTYLSYVIYRNFRIILNLAEAVGMVAMSSYSLRSYDEDCSSSSSLPYCTRTNVGITIIMLLIGVLGTISNIIFLIAFDRLLFWKSTRVRLTLGQACADWKLLC